MLRSISERGFDRELTKGVRTHNILLNFILESDLRSDGGYCNGD
jgi:hypothetical protein